MIPDVESLIAIGPIARREWFELVKARVMAAHEHDADQGDEDARAFLNEMSPFPRGAITTVEAYPVPPEDERAARWRRDEQAVREEMTQ